MMISNQELTFLKYSTLSAVAVNLLLVIFSYFSSTHFSEALISKTLLNRNIQSVSVVTSDSRLLFSSISATDFQEKKDSWYTSSASSFISQHLAGQVQLYNITDNTHLFYISTTAEILKIVKNQQQIPKYLKSISL